MIGTGDSHGEVKRRKVACPLYRTELQLDSLARHMLSHHGDTHRLYKRRDFLEKGERAPTRYYCSSPMQYSIIWCPVPNCRAVVSTLNWALDNVLEEVFCCITPIRSHLCF